MTGSFYREKEVSMEEKIRIIDHYLCIQMPREIDHHIAMKLREAADKLILEKDVENIIFDFQETIMMDSSGIGIILGRLKKMQGLGGKVYILHANDRMKKMLNLAGVMSYVELLKE